MRTIGIDVGYGYVKVHSQGNTISFPAVTAQPSRLLMPRDAGFDFNNLLVEFDDGTRRLVGAAAIRSLSQVAYSPFSADRLEEKAFYHLLVTGLGLAARGGYELLRVVTGLPMAYYHSDADKLRERILGLHRVNFLVNDEIVRSHHLDVAEVDVIPQPMGTLLDVYLDDSGNVADPSVEEQRIGIIDIGFRTTDMFGVNEGLAYDPGYAWSLEMGMVYVYERVARYLHETERIDLSPWQLEREMKHAKITVAGRPVDLSRVYDEALAELADAIWSAVERRWRNLRLLHRIILTGGGGQAVASHLARRAPETLKVSAAPQGANARGFYKLAQQLSAGKEHQG